jgi:sortase A
MPLDQPKAKTAQRAAIIFSYMLMLIGALALVYVAYVFEDARAYQRRAEQAFESIRATEPGAAMTSSLATPSKAAPETAAADGGAVVDVSDPGQIIATKDAVSAALPDGVIGRLTVPRIGLSVMIAEGDSKAVLRRGVGHLSDTPLPGEIGNVVFAGHRDTFFRPLRNIRAGDAITVETLGNSYQYKVEWFRVMPPENVTVLAPSQTSELTLITCFPFNFVGPAPDRFVVRAQEIAASAK